LIFPCYLKNVRMFTHLAALYFFFLYTCTIHSSMMRPGALHEVHHQYGLLAHNYGLYTPLMDMLCGTYKSAYDGPYKKSQPSSKVAFSLQ
jgi:sterol desaturase/sphingolipid hydroxylase (fatty acid hydroxylase superfamily)